MPHCRVDTGAGEHLWEEGVLLQNTADNKHSPGQCCALADIPHTASAGSLSTFPVYLLSRMLHNPAVALYLFTATLLCGSSSSRAQRTSSMATVESNTHKVQQRGGASNSKANTPGYRAVRKRKRMPGARPG
eukprot:scpid73902/ scgid23851/ 